MEKYKHSYRDAISKGIDYRDYPKVKVLPEGEELIAVAGVWGDYHDIRCLFISESNKKYCRTGFRSTKYLIKELNIFGNELS